MNHHLRIHFFFLWTGLLFLLFLSSCSTTRDLGKNEFLLSKTRIKIDKPKIGVSDLQGFIMQKPNTKTLGLLRLKLYTYQVTSRGRETRFKRWILRSIAEKPVILDTHLCNTSGRHMKTYMNNIGYFHSVVSTEYHYHRKLAGVTYKIKSGQPYLLRNINMTFQDDTIRALVEKEKDNTLLRKGHPYNVYTLDEERARITNLLKNKGYYYFSKDYISFQVDSSLNSNEIDLTLLLSNPQLLLNDSTSARVGIRHIPYYLGNVSVYPDYEPFAQDTTAYDTLGFYSTTNVKGKLISRYFYIYKNDLKIRPRTITQNIFLTPGSLFRLDDVDQTYTRLSDLHFFRFVNIEFNPLSSRIQPQDVKSGVLDCNIKLSRNKVMALSLETEGTNSGGDYGLAANVVFENRNIFRGVEQLDVKLKGAMEMQKRFGEFNSSAKTLFFNTYETGVQVSLIFPKFLVPMNPERFPRYFRPKTTINSGFNFQERSGFRRYLAELTFGYDWKESQYKRHILNPIEINSIRIFPDSTFTAYLNSINDRRLTDQYTDHLVMALRYSYIFNNQRINRKGNFFYLKSNFESAGNLLTTANKALGSTKNESGHYTLLGISYAQFVKWDGDFRFYNDLRGTTVVYRAALGLGYPYGNSEALPFDKGFYAGGANGMRGWAIRSLGPGSFNDASSIYKYDKMGDILLESNLEFRFPIIGWLNGAFFGDAGNIWLLNPSEQIPGGEFKWDVFFRQMALDAGFGFRLDFSFFIFRLDGAIKLRDPALDEPVRWVDLRFMNPTDIMWNFGIGYPF